METAWAIGLSGMFGIYIVHLDKWWKTRNGNNQENLVRESREAHAILLLAISVGKMSLTFERNKSKAMTHTKSV